MNAELEQVLIDQLTATRPASILLIAPQVSMSLKRYLREVPGVAWKHIFFDDAEQSLANLEWYEFIIIADTLEYLSIEQAEQLISRLRDLHGKLLWAIVPDSQEQNYSGRHAVAQGMRRVSTDQFHQGRSQWYEYSLAFYKPIPQWLNAEHWANPDQWNKTRW